MKKDGFELKDYLLFSLTVAILFLVYLWTGNMGDYLGNLSESTEQIALLYRITFYAAGVVFALFTGALIYFTVRFWDRGAKDEAS